MVIEGKLAERLDEVKWYYQFESYHDLIRFMITQTFERVRSEPNKAESSRKGKSAETLLDIINSGLVRENMLVEMNDGSAQRYSVPGGVKWVARDDIEHLILTTLKEILKKYR